MEQINKVELRGIVGDVHIYQQQNALPFARITVVTKRAYYQKSSNEDVVESTWHSVLATQGRNIPPLSSIQKGDTVSVAGRIRNGKFTGQDGQERYTSDVIATSLRIEEEQAGVQL